MRPWPEAAGTSPLVVALSILCSLLIGAVLVVAPWTSLWDTNHLLQPHPTLRSVVLSPFARGAVTGLGLVNVLLAFQDVQNALDAAGQSRREYELRREAFAQAREAYRLAEIRYRAGTAAFLTVLQAQQSVFQAAESVLQSQLARFNAMVDLYTALGGGWPGDAVNPS